MSQQLPYAIIADGETDRLLIPIIQWSIHRLDPDVELIELEFKKRSGSVADFISVYDSGAMLIFVHRDAENASLEERLKEFEPIARSDVVLVVPVRMSEAWILFDSSAIAKAAGSSSSRVTVPRMNRIESIADPKGLLNQLLFEAAGSPAGRRGKNFNDSISWRRASVAQNISDYSPLDLLPAFRQFQRSLAARYPYPVERTPI